MEGYKLQCVNRGVIDANVVEYHVTWTSQGVQYKSYVKSFSGELQETSFGEVQTISLDHYRLDEFEKMFILNFQKINDDELKTDTNFNLAYQALVKSDSKLQDIKLIGAAQKPMGLGYIYHIFFRFDSKIMRAEVFLELFSLQATIKSIVNEDFTEGLIGLNQEDTSIKKVIAIIEKEAKKPSLVNGQYTVK